MPGPSPLPNNLPTAAAFPRATVTNRIRECVDRGWALLNARADGPVAFNTFRANRTKWDDQNRVVLRRLFKTDVARLAYEQTGQVPQGAATPKIEMERLRDSVSDKLSLLQMILDQFEGIGESGDSSGAIVGGSKAPVFVAHVGEPALARTVARALEGMRLTPIIVSDSPGDDEIGVVQTDAYRDARFAVVLVAGDQVGGGSGERIAHPACLLWLGYLAGRLGRKNISGLHQPGVPSPGRELGLRSIEFDEGGAWKQLLARRIEAAGGDE